MADNDAPEHLGLTVHSQDDAEFVLDALRAAAEDAGRPLNDSPGRMTEGTMTRGEALVRVCAAYIGHPRGDD